MMHGLTGSEAKSLLFYFFHNIERLDSGECSRQQFVDEVTKQYQEILKSYTKKLNDDIGDNLSCVHVMFGDSPAGSLKHVLEQMGLRPEHHVMTFRDQYSIGPVGQLATPEGRECRRKWTHDRIHLHDDVENCMYDENYFNKTLLQIERIPEHVPITIWSGHNAHEQVGLRYAVYLMRNKLNPIYVINAGAESHTLFDAPGIIVDYRHTGEIVPEKLGIIMKHNEGKTALTKTEKVKLEQEWLSLSENSSVLRIWEQQGIVHVSEDYYDQYMIDTVGKLHRDYGNHEFVKAARVIGEVMGYLDQYLPDSFFEHRLLQLIFSGILEIKGVPRAMRYYSVRLRNWNGRDKE